MIYSLEEESKFLDIDARKKIFKTVEQYAGIHFREIQRKTGLSIGSVQHHLHFLVKHKILSETKENNNLRYFPTNFSSSDKSLLSLLRQKSIRGILLILLTKEKCTHNEIANIVKLSHSTVLWHLKKLELRNIVQKINTGKTYYALKENPSKLANLLIRYRESFFDSLVDHVCEMWD